MLSSFSFNGIRKSFIGVERGTKTAWATISRELINIPGRAGAYLGSTETDVRVKDVPIFIKSRNQSNLRKLEEELAAWLITDEPKETIFDDEKDRIYYAVVDGSLDIEQVVRFGRGVITFICLDPYKYDVQENSVPFESSTEFNVFGSVKAEPVFEVQVEQDTTFLSVSDGEKTNMIGRPLNAGEESFVAEELIYYDQMASTVGWGSTNSIESGVNIGSIASDGYGFYASSFGAGAEGWHGPAVKRSLGMSLQNFSLQVALRQFGGIGQVGAVEVALLNANNEFVAKILMTKQSEGSLTISATAQAGKTANGHILMNTTGGADWEYRYFDGTFKLDRIGNTWWAWVGRANGYGGFDSINQAWWMDSYSIATTQVTQVQVQLWKYGTISAPFQYIDDLKVFKINQQADGVPIIARQGDIVVFDHQNNLITRNGVDITKEKAFIGNYFSLKPGRNTVSIEPSSAVSEANVRWRNKWR